MKGEPFFKSYQNATAQTAPITKKDDTHTMNEPMTIQKAGAAAKVAFDVLAAQLRKRDPSLTEEQAFAKVYEDPAHMSLRLAERNASYAAIGSDLRYANISKAASPHESGEVYNRILGKAQGAHRADPSQTVEQHFARIYSASDAESIALRKVERAERGF